jgi:hypothetical protein
VGDVKWVVTVLVPVVIVPILLTVFTDWSPRLAQWIVRRASRRMPEAYQHRCADEWLAYLADIPGGLSKLAVALSYWVRIPLSRRAVGAPALRFRIPGTSGIPHFLRRVVGLLRRPDADARWVADWAAQQLRGEVIEERPSDAETRRGPAPRKRGSGGSGSRKR